MGNIYLPGDSSTFPPLMAGNVGDRLVAVLAQLTEEVGAGCPPTRLPEEWLGETGCALWQITDPAAVEPARELRRALAELAAAAQTRGPEETGQQLRAVKSALDGAQLVICSEIVTERCRSIPSHLPSFVFMVTLPGLGRRGALALSKRAEELIDDSSR